MKKNYQTPKTDTVQLLGTSAIMLVSGFGSGNGIDQGYKPV